MKSIRILSIILVAALVIGCVLGLVACNDKGNEYLRYADITVYMQENGDIKVEERWDVTVEYDEIRNLYREINLYDGNTKYTSSLEDFSVVDNLTGKTLSKATSLKDPEEYSNSHLDNHYYVYSRGSSKLEIGCYFEPSSNTKLSYTFRYTITDMVALYGDTAVLYYQLFSDDFSLYIDEISIKVVLPGSAQTTADTYAWLHTEVEDSSYEVRSDGIYFSSKTVDTGNYTEIRVLAPNTLFKDTQKSYTELKKDSIIAEEQAWYDSYQATLKRDRAIVIASTVIGAMLVLAGIAAIVYFKKFYSKVKGEYPPYVRDIPEGVTSAEMAHFYYHYKGTCSKQKNRGNMLSATIMDFARRGFISLEPDPKNPDDFTIDVEAVPEAKLSELEKHERILYDLLSEVRGAYTTPFTMSDFEGYSRNHATRVNKAINAYVSESGRGYRSGDYFAHKGFKAQNFLGIGLVCLVVGFMIFIVGELINYLGLGLAAFGILIMIGAPRVNRFNAKGEAKYMQAKGLEAFMLDFSNLKEHEIPALILWEEYMVFATMMGISERVLEELKLRYPVLSEQEGYTHGYYRNRSYLYFYVYMNMRHHGAFDLGASLNRSLSNISTTSHHLVQAAKAQSSANKLGGSGGFGRGGGGFGGGGGGFGGGGGGAR